MSTASIWIALLLIVMVFFVSLAAALWEMCQGLPMEDDE